jgi:exopolysaccharide biosynthesis polyprenyl glycosylphosphotransferase
MELSRAKASRRLSEPQRRSAFHPRMLLVGWDVGGIVATGLACRSLNPSGHAGHTLRELVVILGTAALAVTLLQARGFYRSRAESRRLALLFTLAQAFALMLLALLLWEGLAAFYPGAMAAERTGILALNRNWLFSWTLAAPLLLTATRPRLEAVLWRAVRAPPQRRAVLLADREGVRRLAPVLAAGGLVQLCGFLDIPSRGEGQDREKVILPGPALTRLRDARAVLERGEADLLLIALPETAGRHIAAIDRHMAGVAADIWLAPPDAARFYAAGTRLTALGGFPFLPLRDKPMAGVRAMAKRAEDVVLGLPLLVIALPVMLVIGVAIRLTSPGPALFIQPRLGLNRRIILVRKFRTMRREDGDADGREQTVAGDRRVTPLGRFLRRTSLDELPQLINVVEGTMSLVGPRPHALGTEAAGLPFGEAASDYAARHRVKPGMTGWAQVSGLRGETDTVEKLRHRVAHDLHYIAHWSLLFDLRILALTLRAVVRGEGV